jgi:hypothetical protein
VMTVVRGVKRGAACTSAVEHNNRIGRYMLYG